MLNSGKPIPHVSVIHPGDHVEVRNQDGATLLGRVEELMPSLNLAWIRDLQFGERKIVSPNGDFIFVRSSASG